MINPFLAAPFPTDNTWRTGEVLEVDHPTPHAVRLVLDVPGRSSHLPGQYYILRLTAEDSYTASRSYSLASPPAQDTVELFVERLPGGEVSGFLGEEVRPGDHLEVRGPIGGWFVWDGITPALGVGGGSGVVPMVAMLRHSLAIGRPDLLRLAVSARTLEHLPYADELIEAGVLIALSRAEHSGRPAGRLSADDLAPLIGDRESFFVCGSAPFAESASHLLVDLGVEPGRIRVERFGATT